MVSEVAKASPLCRNKLTNKTQEIFIPIVQSIIQKGVFVSFRAKKYGLTEGAGKDRKSNVYNKASAVLPLLAVKALFQTRL